MSKSNNRIQVTVNIDLRTAEILENRDIDIEKVFKEAVYNEAVRQANEEKAMRSQLDKPEDIAKEVIKLMSRIEGRLLLDWTELRIYLGIKDLELIKEAAELATQINPTIKMYSRGLMNTKVRE